MRKVTYYDLTTDDVENVTFEARFICDRVSEKPSYLKEVDSELKRVTLPWGSGRIDMFWIECYLDSEDLGPLCVVPLLTDPTEFVIGKNWCKVREGYLRLVNRAKEWFRSTEEYKRQVEWTRMLKQLVEEERA